MSNIPEEKPNPSLNAVRHGCCAKTVLSGEDDEPTEWNDAHQSIERFTRYREGAASPNPPDPPKPKPFFTGKNAPKNLRKIHILDQWVEIDIDESGNTVTTIVPSNEDLIKEGHTMDPPPELIYRRLHFVKHVPPEYHWATSSPERRARGGAGIQRMSVDTWLETIEREKLAGTGHIGPCSKPLPRPKERGECDCAVCTKLYAEME